MTTPLTLENEQHAEIFESITQMVRGLARLAAMGNPVSLDDLDRYMKAGSFVRVEFSIGSAGPLGISFQGVNLDGSTLYLASIDAPPSEVPFHFGAEQ